MDTFEIECFLSAVKYHNFTEAAENIFITQSSFSKHIMKLEKSLGVKLFFRTTRSMSLTEAGQAFLPHALKMTEEMTNIKETMKKFSSDTELRIGSVEHISKVGVLKDITDFLEITPKARLNLNEASTLRIMDMLKSKTIDIAIIAHLFYPFSNDTNISDYNLLDYGLITLVKDEYRLIVHRNHHLADRKIVSWSDIEKEKIVILGNEYSMNKVVRKSFEHFGIKPPICFESNQVDTVVGLVKENYGVTFLSKKVADSTPELIAIKIDKPIIRNTVMVYPKKELPEISRQFIDFMKAKYEKI